MDGFREFLRYRSDCLLGLSIEEGPKLCYWDVTNIILSFARINNQCDIQKGFLKQRYFIVAKNDYSEKMTRS